MKILSGRKPYSSGPLLELGLLSLSDRSRLLNLCRLSSVRVSEADACETGRHRALCLGSRLWPDETLDRVSEDERIGLPGR